MLSWWSVASDARRDYIHSRPREPDNVAQMCLRFNIGNSLGAKSYRRADMSARHCIRW
jgi:hypothetical protein